MTQSFFLLFFILFSFTSYSQVYEVEHISDPSVNSEVHGITQGINDTVYFFTSSDMLYKVDTLGQVYSIDYDCPSFCDVHKIAVSQDGALFVTTKWGGILKITNNTTEVILDEEAVTIFVHSSGIVYANVLSDGLGVYDGTNWTFINTSNSALQSNSIYDIAEDSNGDLWMTTGSGLSKLSGNVITNFSFPANLTNLRNVSTSIDGTIWVSGQYAGVANFDGSNWTMFSNIFSPIVSVVGLEVSSYGEVWTSTSSNGVINLSNGEASYLPYDSLGLGSSFIVRAMMVDSMDRLWVSLSNSNVIAIVTKLIDSKVQDSQLLKYKTLISPNPSNGQITLSLDKDLHDIEDKKVIIYDLAAKEILQSDIPQFEENHQITIPNKNMGTYYYTLIVEGQIVSNGKFIVE